MSRRPVHGIVAITGDRTDTDTTRQRFSGDPGGWLPSPATSIDGGHRVRLSLAGRSPDVPAVVSVGPVVAATGDLLVRSIGWRAEMVNDLFPVLNADLELHTSHTPSLRLVGSYTPPLSVLGALTDHVVGQHLAAEVVRRFLTTVAEHLVGRSDLHARVDVPSWHPVQDPGGFRT